MYGRREVKCAPHRHTRGMWQCGHTKVTKDKGTKKMTFHWEPAHQQAFEKLKKLIVHDIVLAYPNFELPFQMYIDASDYFLGAVIV